MTPEDLAKRHPYLFHLTRPAALEGIRRHGLLPPLTLLDLFEADDSTRAAVLANRRASITLTHPLHGEAVVTDNVPLSDKWLDRVLDGGLTPDGWRRMLAERVFFWPKLDALKALAEAKLNKDQERIVLVFDTRSLAEAHGERMEISPINSGATQQSVPRRGEDTYAPLLSTDWKEWQRRRPLRENRPHARDKIKEVTIKGAVPDAARHIVRVATPAELLSRPMPVTA